MASESAQETGTGEAAVHIPFVPLPEHDGIEADEDSAYAGSEGSETQSVNSAIYRGYMEHGRRYQSTREGAGEYFVPADHKQFDHMEALHLAMYILESQQENPFFRSKIAEGAQNIIDLGTGNGDWAIGVADQHPHATVYGVDLYPPPQTWVPPNCILEVDDVTKPWTWNKKFDLVHLRFMLGSFTSKEWDRLYEQIYDNTAPGGWIEHIDCHNQILCDDGTMPADSILASFHKTLGDASDASGRVMFVTDTMKSKIEAAGFINVQERNFKAPIGGWPKHPVYRDSGRHAMDSMKAGFEGWLMYLLTRFGSPKPWTPEEVGAYVEKAKKEFDQNWHIYQNYKRVWAQKPFDAEPQAKQSEPLIENAAAA